MCVIYLLTAFKGMYLVHSVMCIFTNQTPGASLWQTPLLEALGFRTPGLPLVMQTLPIKRWFIVIGGLILGFNIIQR